MYRCADEKISKTENKVTVTYCDVENLDHQNWQLLEGKSYITSISIIKQKISYKNGAGSGFRRKIDRDGGIQKKKMRESGIWEPLLWTLVLGRTFWEIMLIYEAIVHSVPKFLRDNQFLWQSLIRHFHNAHISPCFLQHFCVGILFSISCGMKAAPRESENNAYAKFWGVNKMYYGKW